MIGLSHYARDLALPAELGDPELVCPGEEEIVALVNEHLIGEVSAGLAEKAQVVHVRYKPSVASAATYSVTMDGGVEFAVTYKVHLGDKVEDRSVGGRYVETLTEACAPLKPFALLPERRASLWVFPADPELRGVVRAFDMRRVARWIEQLGVVEPWAVRRRPSVLSLRRYKHSRRAVFHVLAKLRGEDGARDVREFGLRVLPEDKATISSERRMSLASLDLPIPKCVGFEPVAGWILEEWLPGTSVEATDLSAAPQAFQCAGRLHGTPLPGAMAMAMATEPRRRSADPELLRSIPGVDSDDPLLRTHVDLSTTHWIHGDLHPDQVLLQEEGASLLDLDDLRPGAIEEDLASWAADAVTVQNSPGAVEEVLGLYRSHADLPVDGRRLQALTVIELLERAAATIRRLEVEALDRAARWVAFARAVAEERSR